MEEHPRFKDLIWHLIYARDISNELEKARAIFLWLCTKVSQAGPSPFFRKLIRVKCTNIKE